MFVPKQFSSELSDKLYSHGYTEPSGWQNGKCKKKKKKVLYQHLHCVVKIGKAFFQTISEYSIARSFHAMQWNKVQKFIDLTGIYFTHFQSPAFFI